MTVLLLSVLLHASFFLLKSDISNLLSFPERSFLCARPSRYVFPGAEVYSDEEGDPGDDESDNESIHSLRADDGMSPTSSEENNEKERCSVDPTFKEKLDKIDGLGCRNGPVQHLEGMADHAS